MNKHFDCQNLEIKYTILIEKNLIKTIGIILPCKGLRCHANNIGTVVPRQTLHTVRLQILMKKIYLSEKR